MKNVLLKRFLRGMILGGIGNVAATGILTHSLATFSDLKVIGMAAAIAFAGGVLMALDKWARETFSLS